jgi:hypothetical protein
MGIDCNRYGKTIEESERCNKMSASSEDVEDVTVRYPGHIIEFHG